MRFIGSKTKIIPYIEETINDFAHKDSKIFCDIFSGSTAVSKYFKNKYQIISNDMLNFSYVLQKAYVSNNKKPVFNKLKDLCAEDPIRYLNNKKVEISDFNCPPYFYLNFSPNDFLKRKYLQNKNALKIDFIREKIEKWKARNLLSDTEYYYLLAALIESIPFVSNIAGTYGAYLKHWDKRTFKDLMLKHLEINDNSKKNVSHNEDSNSLIKKISGDILYIDPPYNTRQYFPNYHLLENVSRYDKPDLYGVSGLSKYEEYKSNYSIRNRAVKSFNELIKYANFRNIIVSYSSEGIMELDEIESILFNHCDKSSYKLKKIPYRRYKHQKDTKKNSLIEYIFYIRK